MLRTFLSTGGTSIGESVQGWVAGYILRNRFCDYSFTGEANTPVLYTTVLYLNFTFITLLLENSIYAKVKFGNEWSCSKDPFFFAESHLFGCKIVLWPLFAFITLFLDPSFYEKVKLE